MLVEHQGIVDAIKQHACIFVDVKIREVQVCIILDSDFKELFLSTPCLRILLNQIQLLARRAILTAPGSHPVRHSPRG